jgi:hypothetical protein
MEKLPLTPGPIVPAREQLGELLLQMNQPSDACNNLRRHCSSHRDGEMRC